jgi:hypothetical protein
MRRGINNALIDKDKNLCVIFKAKLIKTAVLFDIIKPKFPGGAICSQA